MSKEQYNKHELWLLEYIKNNAISGKAFLDLEKIASFDNAPTIEAQRKIIHDFQNKGIIRIFDETLETLSDGVSVKPTAIRGGFAILPVGFHIRILHPQFDEALKSKPQNILPETGVVFDENSSKLIFEGVPIKIPPHKNEYYFCKKLFSYPKGALVSWDEIYEEMEQGDIPDDIEKNRRSVMDTMYVLNKRIKRKIKTANRFFSRRNNTIERHF